MKKMKFNPAAGLPWLLVTLLLFCSACRKEPSAVFGPDAPAFAVQVHVSTNQLSIGDVVQVKLTVRHPADAQLRVPSPEQGKNIVVRDLQTTSTPGDDEIAETVQQYALTSFRPGSHVIWTQQAACVRSDDSILTADIPDSRLEVISVLSGSENRLQDIKGLAQWPSDHRIWLFALLALLLLAGGGLFWFFRRKRQQPAAPVAIPIRPPDVIALEALEQLLAKGLIEAHEVEPYYVELSSITRAYLENRFQLRAPEQTTEEFIYEAVHSRLLDATQQQVLRAFLEQCDLVKFARFEPQEQDMLNAYDAAKHFVTETRPVSEEVSS